MACPDELTLDLWLAGALPFAEAAALADHVPTCAACAAASQAARALDADLHAALALDDAELAYLAGLALGTGWRTSPAAGGAAWGWIALVGVVAGFAAWLVAAPIVSAAVAAAAQVGLGTVLLSAAFGFFFSLGQVVLDLTRNPALGLSQPLLALLALALLIWPRQFFPYLQRSTHA